MERSTLKQDESINPYAVGQYAAEQGYYTYGQGTSWDIMTEGAVYYDLEYLNGSVSADYILENLTSDTPMICSMTPGNFTTSGHFIVLTGIDEERVEIFVLIEDGLQNDYKHRA